MHQLLSRTDRIIQLTGRGEAAIRPPVTVRMAELRKGDRFVTIDLPSSSESLRLTEAEKAVGLIAHYTAESDPWLNGNGVWTIAFVAGERELQEFLLIRTNSAPAIRRMRVEGAAGPAAQTHAFQVLLGELRSLGRQGAELMIMRKARRGSWEVVHRESDGDRVDAEGFAKGGLIDRPVAASHVTPGEWVAPDAAVSAAPGGAKPPPPPSPSFPPFQQEGLGTVASLGGPEALCVGDIIRAPGCPAWTVARVDRELRTVDLVRAAGVVYGDSIERWTRTFVTSAGLAGIQRCRVLYRVDPQPCDVECWCTYKRVRT